MSLTRGGGPLATPAPDAVNYVMDGPAHKLLMTPFPRRARALIDGVTVLDTTAGQLVHESNISPVLYVPRADVLVPLQPSETVTHCPFKGDASHFHVGDVADAAWSYEEPIEAAAWLQGMVALYAKKFDWLDEDEPVRGLRDPYHRCDVRPSSRTVTVTLGGEVLAQSARALVLSETALPNRWYLPLADVRTALEATTTTTHCPYKGDARYWSVAGVPDAVWAYDEPLDGVAAIAGHVSFLGDGITVEVG
ncbi:MAG: hypothetical protein QOF76_1100 [Solirubrobacteraceae bacterium]|jgi:uncharacterized protein (DUF427 family)|nr:hypothetical protein [Solirubrobacteraceae bacterium]